MRTPIRRPLAPRAPRRLPLLLAAAGLAWGLGGCVVVVKNEGQAEPAAWSAGGRPRLGVTIEEVGPALAAQTGADPGRSTLVTEVVPGTPAARAGVQRYDIITAIDGVDRAAPFDVRSAAAHLKEGSTLTLRVLRAGEPLEIVVAGEPPRRGSGYAN